MRYKINSRPFVKLTWIDFTLCWWCWVNHKLSALFPHNAAEVPSSRSCLTADWNKTTHTSVFFPFCLCFSPLQGCTTGISCSLRWVESPPWCFVPKYAGEGNKKGLMGQQEKVTKGRVWPAGQTGSFTFFHPGSAHTFSRLAGGPESHPWITYWVTAQACEKIMADVVPWSHVRMCKSMDKNQKGRYGKFAPTVAFVCNQSVAVVTFPYCFVALWSTTSGFLYEKGLKKKLYCHLNPLLGSPVCFQTLALNFTKH